MELVRISKLNLFPTIKQLQLNPILPEIRMALEIDFSTILQFIALTRFD